MNLESLKGTLRRYLALDIRCILFGENLFSFFLPGSLSNREYLKLSAPLTIPKRLCFILPGANAETDTFKSHLLLYYEFVFLLLVRLPIGDIMFWKPGLFFRAL